MANHFAYRAEFEATGDDIQHCVLESPMKLDPGKFKSGTRIGAYLPSEDSICVVKKSDSGNLAFFFSEIKGGASFIIRIQKDSEAVAMVIRSLERGGMTPRTLTLDVPVKFKSREVELTVKRFLNKKLFVECLAATSDMI
tara:strand:+ start:876 stop:1295 length:420 start_codon:yes stop_codon:yes gene_type:complete